MISLNSLQVQLSSCELAPRLFESRAENEVKQIGRNVDTSREEEHCSNVKEGHFTSCGIL